MKRMTRNEQGQSMVLMALILASLLGFLALAIDGSNNYLQRRRMQNAADGAAIAGAVALASGQTSELALCSTIREYAVTRHGADSDQVTMFYTPRDVPIQCLNQATPDWTNGVRVVVGHQFGSFVAGIIGRSSFNVLAEATAQFGAASSVVGVSPLAIADFDFQYGVTYTFWGQDCEHHECGEGGDDDDGGDGDDDDHEGDDDDGDEHHGDSGMQYSLTSSSPESGDFTGAFFAFIDPGCEFPNKCNTSDAQLKQWMRDGFRTEAVFERTRLQGDPGGQYGWPQEHRVPPRDAHHILKEAHVGQVLILPVYDIAYHYTTDSICNDDPGNHRDYGGTYDPGPNPGQCHNNPVYGQCGWCDPSYAVIIDTYTTNGTYNDKHYYNIISFAAFEVTEVHDHGDDKYIRGHFVQYVAPQGEMGGTEDNGVIIIKLTQ